MKKLSLFLLPFLVLFCFSCSSSFNEKISQGTISFVLPKKDIERAGTTLPAGYPSEYVVKVQSLDGNFLREESYPAGNKVFIENLPINNYKISINGTGTDFDLSGESDTITIKPNTTVPAKIVLNKIFHPLYVKAGVAPGGNGSKNKPFDTIQNAITAISTKPDADKGLFTFYIDGSFIEILSVEQSTTISKLIIEKAPDAATAEIKNPGSGNPYVVHIDKPDADVKLKGLKLTFQTTDSIAKGAITLNHGSCEILDTEIYLSTIDAKTFAHIENSSNFSLGGNITISKCSSFPSHLNPRIYINNNGTSVSPITITKPITFGGHVNLEFADNKNIKPMPVQLFKAGNSNVNIANEIGKFTLNNIWYNKYTLNSNGQLSENKQINLSITNPPARITYIIKQNGQTVTSNSFKSNGLITSYYFIPGKVYTVELYNTDETGSITGAPIKSEEITISATSENKVQFDFAETPAPDPNPSPDPTPGETYLTITEAQSLLSSGTGQTDLKVEIKDETELTNLVNSLKSTQHSVSLKLKTTLTAIPNSCFSGCTSLTSIILPDTITAINERAFENCKKLAEITIPNSIETIGVLAFSNCAVLNNVVLPTNQNYTTISMSTFDGCAALTNITISNTVTTINGYAFGNCTNLKSITIPESVTEILAKAFGNITLESVIFKNTAGWSVNNKPKDVSTGTKGAQVINAQSSKTGTGLPALVRK